MNTFTACKYYGAPVVKILGFVYGEQLINGNETSERVIFQRKNSEGKRKREREG